MPPRYLFLGDSITFHGAYLHSVETFLLLETQGEPPEFINIGLSSETVSGLSEPGHAEGTFDRPHLHERLSRILARIEADSVFACYGMNDGIYLPFDTGRFALFHAGIHMLRVAVEKAGLPLILLTPPLFDGVQARNPDYEEVVARATAWLLEQRRDGWAVIDTHGPMRRALDERRRRDPGFHFADDGIHPGPEGHAILARAVLEHLLPDREIPDLDVFFADAARAALRERVGKRQTMLRDLWLGITGHRRPGLPSPPNPFEAQKLRAALDQEINALSSPRTQILSPAEGLGVECNPI